MTAKPNPYTVSRVIKAGGKISVNTVTGDGDGELREGELLDQDWRALIAALGLPEELAEGASVDRQG